MKTARENPVHVWDDDVLVFHILPKLPVKSLFPFMCVCKKWLRWISDDPAFAREQFRSSLASPGFAYMGDAGLGFISLGGSPIDVPDPSLKFLEASRIRIVASCNGILCVSAGEPGPTQVIFVCNPLTREWSLVPQTRYHWWFGLAFDPLGSPQTYKLVCPYPVECIEGSWYFEFQVFSSDTGVWMSSKEKVGFKNHQFCASGSMFAGGILYWTLLGHIVWLDLQKDLVGSLLLPSNDCRGFADHVLGVWEEKLSYTRTMVGKWIETWMMIEFKWTRILRVNLDSLIQGPFFRFEIGCTESILPFQGGEYLHLVLQRVEGFEIICYNTKTREVTISKEYGERGCYKWPVFPYNSSFVRLPKLSNCVS